MRNYRINTTNDKTAFIRNLYNGDEFKIAFPLDDELMDRAIRRATSNGEHDYAIVDLDGFYNFVDSDFANIDELNDIAERLERLEDDDADKLEAMAEYCDNLEDIESAWNNSYFYADTTLADYAELHAEECGFLEAVPDFIRGYIDWEDMAEDMKIDDGYSEINGGVLYVAR